MGIVASEDSCGHALAIKELLTNLQGLVILYLTLLISEIEVYTHLRKALFGQIDFILQLANIR